MWFLGMCKGLNLSWLWLPSKKDDETSIIGKDGRRRKVKRRRLVPPASLYESYMNELGVDNYHYDVRSSDVTLAKTRIDLSFVEHVHKFEDELLYKSAKYLNNKIRTTKYTLLSFFPKNLFEQFHRLANFYFLLLIALNFVPQLNAFGKEVSMLPLLVVLTAQALKDAYEDYTRYLSDKEINRSIVNVFRW